jgi:hypothetical protein
MRDGAERVRAGGGGRVGARGLALARLSPILRRLLVRRVSLILLIAAAFWNPVRAEARDP